MKTQDQIIHDEMRLLIHRSCEFTENLNRDSYGFQKSLLKFYFGVVDVTIDYDKEEITLYRTKSRKDARNRLYDINEAGTVKVSYANLEETLKGCLERSEKDLNFYTSLLFHYHKFKPENQSHILTA